MAIGNDNLDVNILCIVLLNLLDRDIVMSISNGRGKVVTQGIDLSRNMSIGNSKCSDSRWNALYSRYNVSMLVP